MTHAPASAWGVGCEIPNCLDHSTIAVPGLGTYNIFGARNYLTDRAATAQHPKISQYSTNYCLHIVG